MEKDPYQLFHIYVSDLEEEAENFLRKYQCEDAISTPRRIPIYDIATRLMQLDVVETESLSHDGSVSGAIAFGEGVIDVYDWEAQGYIGYPVTFPSVFIDADITSAGRKNNTLAHECYHWYKHRLYFKYKQTHDHSPEFAFRCSKTIADDKYLKNTDIGKMEWQARNIAPKILMPRKAALCKIDELHKKSEGFVNRREATELIIREFADFYGVSFQSAAIRMAELGYEPAIEPAREVTDFSEIHPFERRRTRAKKRQQPISQVAAFELYLKDDNLRTLLDTGVFRYANGYFVLNKAAYVTNNNDGTYEMTEFARTHLAECTIDFSEKFIQNYLMHAAPSLMYRSDFQWVSEKSVENSAQNVEIFNAAKTLQDTLSQFESDFQREKSTSYEDLSGTEIMWNYIKEAGWSNTVFQTMTELAPADYTRLQKNHNFKLEAFMAMGVGLGLTVDEMEKVLSASNMKFTDNRRDENYRKHKAYKFVLTTLHGCTITQCNDFLEEAGIEPLGTKNRY